MYEILLLRLCKIYILFILLKNWWLKKNCKRIKILKVRIGINFYPNLIKKIKIWKKRKKSKKLKNSDLFFLMSNKRERLIFKWKVESIFYLKSKSNKNYYKNDKREQILKNNKIL